MGTITGSLTQLLADLREGFGLIKLKLTVIGSDHQDFIDQAEALEDRIVELEKEVAHHAQSIYPSPGHLE